MHKKIFAVFAASLLALGVSAQTAPVENKETAVVGETAKPVAGAEDNTLVLKEREYNFGKIPQGKPVTHVFEIVNNGTDSLHIENVQASCGCTTPTWDHKKSPAPGETTNITVGYNAASEGAFSKQVTITYNGTQTKYIIIKGEVWKTPANSAPENKALGSLKD